MGGKEIKKKKKCLTGEVIPVQFTDLASLEKRILKMLCFLPRSVAVRSETVALVCFFGNLQL